MAERGRTEIRRRDRARDDAWTRDFIRQARVGVLAMTRGEQPLVNSNLLGIIYHLTLAERVTFYDIEG